MGRENVTGKRMSCQSPALSRLERGIRCLFFGCVPVDCLHPIGTSISQPQPLRVVVVGGGPAGLACAIGFGNFGHKATVLEKRASPIVVGTIDKDRSSQRRHWLPCSRGVLGHPQREREKEGTTEGRHAGPHMADVRRSQEATRWTSRLVACAR